MLNCIKQYHKQCCNFYNVLLWYNYIKCSGGLIYIVSSTNYLYKESTKRRVSLTFYASFWWFYLSNINLLYCYTRTTILAKIVILVHYSLFSIKVCLVHLNIHIKSALKVNLLQFTNMYCSYCVHINKMWYLRQFHFRTFSSCFNLFVAIF